MFEKLTNQFWAGLTIGVLAALCLCLMISSITKEEQKSVDIIPGVRIDPKQILDNFK
jgi:YbbR domain-containing protein